MCPKIKSLMNKQNAKKPKKLYNFILNPILIMVNVKDKFKKILDGGGNII